MGRSDLLLSNRLGPTLLAGLVALCGVTPAAPAGVVATAVAGPWAALGLDDGRVVLFDVERETRREWKAPAPSILAISIDPAAEASPVHMAGTVSRAESGTTRGERTAPLMLLAAPDPGGGSSTIFAMSGITGETLGSAHAGGEVAFLLSAPGAHVAYAVTRRLSPAGGDQPAREGRWILSRVDLHEERPSSPIALDGPVSGAALSADGGRIFLAFEDRIRTYVTDPLRSSWQFRSPGPNGPILPLGSGGPILAGRGARLSLFDPDHLPGRDAVTGSFPKDDAAFTIDLPFEASALAAAPDGARAAAMTADGSRLALIDLEHRRVAGVRETPDAPLALFHPERGALVLLGRNGASVAELAWQPEGAALPVPSPEATAAAGPEDAAAPGPSPVPGDESAGAAPAAGSPSPRAALPSTPESAVPGEIRGRITGEVALVKSVVFYGPNSISKEHMRVAPAPDGTYSAPIPPPGRYRILLDGAGGAQLSYTPPYWHIEIAVDGLAGIDFHVAGVIRGSLNP